MLVRFFRIVVIALGFSLVTLCQPVVAQEKSIHGDKDTKSNPLVKTDHERPKPEPRPVQPTKATIQLKTKKGAPSNPAGVVERPRGVSPRAQRSVAAQQAFERQTGYANGRPGYIVEHIVPLSCGGTDTPGNME